MGVHIILKVAFASPYVMVSIKAHARIENPWAHDKVSGMPVSLESRGQVTEKYYTHTQGVHILWDVHYIGILGDGGVGGTLG